MMVERKNYLEISFEKIPSISVRNQLKELGFSWNPISKIWFAPATEEREDFIKYSCR